MSLAAHSDRPDPAVSVVAPAHNEEDNIGPLVDEVGAAMLASGHTFEFIIVDDGSTDRTRARVLELAARNPWLRCVAMTNTPTGRGHGQSAAFHAGFRAARGRWIATLDADLQNDPADIPRMLETLRGSGSDLTETNADMVQGDRSRARKDNVIRRWGSVVGRLFRRAILGDAIRDTGCSLRVMRREIALRLPLEFRGMHRFIPVTARHMGYTVIELDVTHRPRIAGQTKYGLGILQRALPGLVDCLAVRYMRSRRRPVTATDVKPDQPRIEAKPARREGIHAG